MAAIDDLFKYSLNVIFESWKMAEVSEGLCNIREYVLLENKTSSTIKHGDSDGIGLMRMRRLQSIVTSMQSHIGQS